jgi:hypothetical protein
MAPTVGLTAGPIILPGDAYSMSGKTYQAWSAAWWTYYLQIPPDKNPGFDESGANCAYLQSGSVFFLMGTAGGSVRRTQCTVPAGKVLFFPLLTTSYYQTHETELGLKGFLQSFVRSAHELHASIDGTDIGSMVSLVPSDSPLRAASPDGFFPVIAVDNNIFGGVPGQIYDTAVDGFYLMVAPLSRGPHTLSFGGSSRDFATDTTYLLNAQ